MLSVVSIAERPIIPNAVVIFKGVIHDSHATTGNTDSKKQHATMKGAKSKNMNNQMIPMNPTSVQELRHVCKLANCAIHITDGLRRLTSKKTGKACFKCSVKNCPVFCIEDKLVDYCNAIAIKLSPIYKCYTLPCKRDKPSNLRVSNSWDNQQRPFSCGQKVTFTFFQWRDEELADENFQIMMELEKRQMKNAAKELFLYKLGNPSPMLIRWSFD